MTRHSWRKRLEPWLSSLFRDGLEDYRRTAHVGDMAHSGDPNTFILLPDGRAISIIEYYKQNEPETYKTWRRLCWNTGINPDKFAAGDPEEQRKYVERT